MNGLFSKHANLTVILPTEAILDESERLGLLGLWEKRFQMYKRYVKNIDVFSCDNKDYSAILGISHHPLPFTTRIPYLKHLLYHVFLLFHFSRMKNPIRVISAGYLTLPLGKAFWGKRFILSYHYAYAVNARLDFGKLKGFVAQFLEYLSIKSSCQIIVTTQELSEYISNRYARESSIIPNAVNTEIFKPRTVEQGDYLLYVGRLVESKGIWYLLEAFRLLKVSFPRLELKLVGGTESQVAHWSREVTAMGLNGVLITGPVSQATVSDYMQGAIALVLPSLTREGQAKVLLEAMFCRCLCITTNVPGNRDLITHNQNGLIVDPADENVLSSIITQVLLDKNMRELIVNRAFDWVQQFRIEEVFQKEISLLERYESRIW